MTWIYVKLQQLCYAYTCLYILIHAYTQVFQLSNYRLNRFHLCWTVLTLDVFMPSLVWLIVVGPQPLINWFIMTKLATYNNLYTLSTSCRRWTQLITAGGLPCCWGLGPTPNPEPLEPRPRPYPPCGIGRSYASASEAEEGVDRDARDRGPSSFVGEDSPFNKLVAWSLPQL